MLAMETAMGDCATPFASGDKSQTVRMLTMFVCVCVVYVLYYTTRLFAHACIRAIDHAPMLMLDLVCLLIT